MRIINLREELVGRYGEEFDLRKNWCFGLLNSRDDMETGEIIVLLYYLRSLAFASPGFPLFCILKMGIKDQFLLSQSDKCLGGEILVNNAGKNIIIGAMKYYEDETGRRYLPNEIMVKGLYLEVEDREEYEGLFYRSCRLKEQVQQRLQKKKAVVLMTEPGHLDYYIISLSLLSSEKRQGEKRLKLAI